jgi:hypothetical protein
LSDTRKNLALAVTGDDRRRTARLPAATAIFGGPGRTAGGSRGGAMQMNTAT